MLLLAIRDIYIVVGDSLHAAECFTHYQRSCIDKESAFIVTDNFILLARES